MDELIGPWTCSSRGVPAGGAEVESCEKDAVVCVRNDWDDRTDRSPAYCNGCASERAYYGDKPLWVPDLVVGTIVFRIEAGLL